MAAAGLGSRRTLEKYIAEGAVRVNGRAAALGCSVCADDTIAFRDREWRVTAENSLQRTLIYNKPEGELTTRSDPAGRPTVFDRLPGLKDARWVAVGRLDINTTGLLLLTTDGELANAMMHPSNRVDREYVCRIRGQVSEQQVEQLKTGVELDDGPARFSDVQRMDRGTTGNLWFQVTLLEGRNREVRRLWEAVGCMVSRLKRVRYGAARLPRGLKMGRFAEITAQEHRVLRQDVNLAVDPGILTLTEVRGGAQRQRTRRRPRPPAPRATAPMGNRRRDGDNRPGARPGSPAGPGRRPHPRSRKSGR